MVVCYVIIYSVGHKHCVGLQRLLVCAVFLSPSSLVQCGDCTSECSQIREDVGLLQCWIIEMFDY